MVFYDSCLQTKTIYATFNHSKLKFIFSDIRQTRITYCFDLLFKMPSSVSSLVILPTILSAVDSSHILSERYDGKDLLSVYL